MSGFPNPIVESAPDSPINHGTRRPQHADGKRLALLAASVVPVAVFLLAAPAAADLTDSPNPSVRFRAKRSPTRRRWTWPRVQRQPGNTSARRTDRGGLLPRQHRRGVWAGDPGGGVCLPEALRDGANRNLPGTRTGCCWTGRSEGPGPAPEADRVEVDLSRQLLYLIEAGEVTGVFPVSSANGESYRNATGRTVSATTPEGRFTFQRSREGWWESYLGFLYRPFYFYGGYAIHGSGSVPRLPGLSWLRSGPHRGHGFPRHPASAWACPSTCMETTCTATP